MTPFDFPIISETDDLTDYGRTSHFTTLEAALKNTPMQNVFIQSPFGTGKTTLLSRFFTEERKAKLFERGILVQFCCFTGSQMRSDADVYICLINAVKNGLQQISGHTELHKEISAGFQKAEGECKNYRMDETEGASLLTNMLYILQNKGFRMVMVFDNFQSLTCSECCSVHTFNYMSSLAQAHSLTFVVATDFHSKVASKAYGLSDFERIMDIRTELEGISPTKNKVDCRYLQKKIREVMKSFQANEGTLPEDMIEISDAEMTWLFELTAGIPLLLQNGLKTYYIERQDGWICESKEVFERVIYSGCKSVMMEWTKYFNSDYWAALNHIYYNRSLDSKTKFFVEEEKWKGLHDSRLVISASAQGEYRFICPLFERYVHEALPAHMKDIAPPPSQCEKYDVFLSYKHTDGTKMGEVEDFLKSHRKVVFDDKCLPEQGDPEYHSALLEALGDSKNFIVIISDYRLLTAKKIELKGDWVNFEMCSFKKRVDEGVAEGNFILLVADEIYDELMRTGKRDLNNMWNQNTIFIAWRDYKSKLAGELK